MSPYFYLLPSIPMPVSVEVVLRHFHRCRYRSIPLWFFCWRRFLASWLLAMDEHSGLEDLRGLGRRSVIPYIHRRTELYCSSLYELEPSLFSPPRSGVHSSLL
jgi:hypothetical protein